MPKDIVRPLTSSVALITIGMLLGSDRSATQATIQVGPNALVSRDEANSVHYEVLVDAHPSDPKQLLACSQVYAPDRNRDSNHAYISTDGGVTWTRTLNTDAFDQTGDPACAYGLDGAAYHMTLGQSFSSRQWGGVEPKSTLTIPVYRSSDSGRTWDVPRILNTTFTANDREWVVVDGTQSPYRGRVYMNSTVWTNATGPTRARALALYRSRDGGRTFEGPVTQTANSPTFLVITSNPAILSDGTVVFAFVENPAGLTAAGDVRLPDDGVTTTLLKATASTDGGESLELPTTIGTIRRYGGAVDKSIPSLAVDPGSAPFKDRLYVVWSDQRAEQRQILLAYSSDKGRTWSNPVVVSDDGSPPGAARPHMPAVAVNKAGVVGVLWSDRREDPGTLHFCPRFAASLDGGQTFLPSVRVAASCRTTNGVEQLPVWAQGTARPNPNAPVRINVWVFPRFYSGADTLGLAADTTGVFHPVWTDNRTSLPQVWTAPVTVTGQVLRHGSVTLEDMVDVTAKTALTVTATNYDRAAETLTLDLQIRNVSTDVLRAPMRVRVVGLASALGNVQIINQDSESGRAGAELDFTSLLPNGMLKPQERSGPRRVTVRVSDRKPAFSGGNVFTAGLVHLDVLVYGRISTQPIP